MNQTKEARQPKFNPILNEKVLQAFAMPSNIHYGIKRIWKGKKITVPICGAMSTFITEDIKKCNCKDCIVNMMKIIHNPCIHIDKKLEGDNENEQ